MYIEEDEELVQVILDGNAQTVIDFYSSRAYGWIKKCNSLAPSQIDDVVDSLNLDESDSAAIKCRSLESVLSDIEEHGEYSEYYGEEEEIKERLVELKKKIQTINGYEWEYLYQLAQVVEDGHIVFAYSARERMTDPMQIEFLKKFEEAKSDKRADILMNTKDFSFMSTLSDEAILSTLAQSIIRGASKYSPSDETIEAEKKFEAFEYYVKNRPLPLCFGTHIIDQAIKMASNWENQKFADKVLPYIDKITPNVNTYTSLCRFYYTYKNREKLIENLKLADQYGAESSDFNWFRFKDNPWKDDEEVLSFIPKNVE